MNKTIPTAVGIAFTAITSTSTVILTSANSENLEQEGKTEPPKIVWANKLVTKLNLATDIKSQYKDIECLKEYQGEDNGWAEANPKDTSSQFDLTKVDKDDIESCLMVEYHQRTYTNNKWWGDLSLIWTLKHDNDVMITAFNSKADNGKLSIDAVIYVLKKENNKKWIIQFQQDSSKQDIVNNDDLSKKFPKPGNKLKYFKDQDYWGLNLDPEKVCKDKENDCPKNLENPNDFQSSKSLKWFSSSGSNVYKVYEWSSNFNIWFKNLFPNWTDIDNKLSKFEGSWY